MTTTTMLGTFLAVSGGAMIGILVACFLPIFLILFVFKNKKKKNEKP